MCSAISLPNFADGLGGGRSWSCAGAADLVLHLVDEIGVTMADRDGDDAGEGVRGVTVPFSSQTLRHLAFDEEQGSL